MSREQIFAIVLIGIFMLAVAINAAVGPSKKELARREQRKIAEAAREAEREADKLRREVVEAQKNFEQCTTEKPVFEHNLIVNARSASMVSENTLQLSLCSTFKELQAQDKLLQNNHKCKKYTIKYTYIDDFVDSYGGVKKDVKMPAFQATWKWEDAMKYNCDPVVPDMFIHANIVYSPGWRYVSKTICPTTYTILCQ